MKKNKSSRNTPLLKLKENVVHMEEKPVVQMGGKLNADSGINETYIKNNKKIPFLLTSVTFPNVNNNDTTTRPYFIYFSKENDKEYKYFTDVLKKVFDSKKADPAQNIVITFSIGTIQKQYSSAEQVNNEKTIVDELNQYFKGDGASEITISVVNSTNIDKLVLYRSREQYNYSNIKKDNYTNTIDDTNAAQFNPVQPGTAYESLQTLGNKIINILQVGVDQTDIVIAPRVI